MLNPVLIVLSLLLLLGSCLPADGKFGKQQQGSKALRGDVNAMGETSEVTLSEAKIGFMGTTWTASDNKSFIIFDPTVKNVMHNVTFLDEFAYICKPFIYDFRRKSSLLFMYGDDDTVNAFRVNKSGSSLSLISTSMQIKT